MFRYVYGRDVIKIIEVSLAFLNFYVKLDNSLGHPYKMFRFPSPDRPIFLEK